MTENTGVDFEEYKEMLVCKTLTNLFFTKQEGPYDYMPGTSPAYYVSTIIEIGKHKKLRFDNNFIVDWNDEEPLVIAGIIGNVLQVGAVCGI